MVITEIDKPTTSKYPYMGKYRGDIKTSNRVMVMFLSKNRGVLITSSAGGINYVGDFCMIFDESSFIKVNVTIEM